MVILVLLVLLLRASSDTQQQLYRLADMGFPPLTEPCVVDDTAMLNALATLRISNDLLASRLTLEIDTTVEAGFSCYLCQQYGVDYCNTTLNASRVYLSDDAAYNVQVLDQQAGTVTNYAVVSDAGQGNFIANLTVPLTNSTCGGDGRLFLISVMLEVDMPNNQHSKDFLTLAMPTPPQQTPPAVTCEGGEASLYAQMSIDCLQFPFIQLIRYQTTQCVTIGNTPIVLPPPEPNTPIDNLVNFPPLYWYAALVLDGNASTATRPALPYANDSVLCGTRYDLLLLATQLYQTTCYLNNSERVLTDTTRWWDTLFIHFLTLRLNAANASIANNSRLWYTTTLMYDQLERTCLMRDQQLRDNTSLLFLIQQAQTLYVRAVQVDERALCDVLMTYFTENFAATEKDALQLAAAWYLETFSFLVLPSKATQTKLVFFVVSIFLTLLFGVLCLGIISFPLRVKLRKPVQSI